MKNIDKKNIEISNVNDLTELPDLSELSDLSGPLNSDKSNQEDIISADSGSSTSTSNITEVGSGLNILKNEDNDSHENILKADDDYQIFPPLGIARVGNGPANKQDSLFISEAPWQNLYKTDNNYLTSDGKVKKVAQRFRVIHNNGTTPFDASKYYIKWTVEVANKKPFWYYFNNCLDLSVENNNTQDLSKAFYEDKIAPAVTANRRNPNITDGKNGTENYRKELVNNPGPVSVGNDPGSRQRVEIMGTFPSNLEGESNVVKLLNTTQRNVKLGTIECDTDGSLIFYAGDGLSASLVASDLNTDFADNSNWYDDICDGRVTAELISKSGVETISINTAENASWIATTPPDYAPQIQPIVSMSDLMIGVSDSYTLPDTIKFGDVFAIFYKLYRQQWVNLGDFLAPSFKEKIDQYMESGGGSIKKLYDNSDANRGFRESIFKLFRNPAYNTNTNEPIIPTKNETSIKETGVGKDPLLLPYYPGDGVDYPGSPAQWFAIPPHLYEVLEKYRDGVFEIPKDFENLDTMDDIAKYYEQSWETYFKSFKGILGLGALESLYGGGFHPGVELTWPFRHRNIYQTCSFFKFPPEAPITGFPYIRINAASKEEQAAVFYNDFGQQINAQDVQDSLVPGSDKSWLWKITPGDLTKWMGIPWQSDAASCQLVYTDSEYPIPAWWAANLPVSVLTSDSYEKLKDTTITKETRERIYANRENWLHTVDSGYVGYHAEGGYTNGLISMVNKWKDIGFVTGRPKPATDLEGVPETVYVAYQSKKPR